MRKEEAKLQDKFIALLKKENILYIKTTGGLSYLPAGEVKRTDKGTYTGEFRPIKNKEGFADVIVFKNYEKSFKNSQTFFIEIKTDTSKLRPSQIEKFNELTNKGFDCYILRPKHWKEAKKQSKLNFLMLLDKMEYYKCFIKI
ncbi:VRR-NUC domain-containing protein [Mesoplasma melaleucae]|uniref:VRR-NUC domain-containing protein n=1 Tax=Mesoplasma melaleucae TaxID=81459 RepID=A0A2K8NVF5_9MOLU|nr:VRR-NUC domain-containing protein [Mesoplasma melaleucae]ATZ17799.1 hypothetical protein EMELA_v1c02260 [Mesoplasma melaleucae]